HRGRSPPRRSRPRRGPARPRSPIRPRPTAVSSSAPEAERRSSKAPSRLRARVAALDESSEQEEQSAQRAQPELALPVAADEPRVEGVRDPDHRDELQRASEIEGHERTLEDREAPCQNPERRLGSPPGAARSSASGRALVHEVTSRACVSFVACASPSSALVLRDPERPRDWPRSGTKSP